MWLVASAALLPADEDVTYGSVLALGGCQGGYIAADWHVRRFWRVVESFSPSEQSALLRFVTG